MLRNALCFSLLLLLNSCKSTTEISPSIPLTNLNQNLIIQLPSDVDLKSWAYQIKLFYIADAETVILPYINLVRSFDGAIEGEFCSTENNKKIALALELNPSSLFSHLQLYNCAYQAGNEAESDEHLMNVQSIAETLLKRSSGEDIADAIEVRELDEAHIILDLSGMLALDLEIVEYYSDFVYKFHVYDGELGKFEYRYFKNSQLLRAIYGSLNGSDLTIEQTKAISLSTYKQQKFSAALIPIARQLLLEKKFQQVIELLSPLPKDSGMLITLLAEAYLRVDNVDELSNLLDSIEVFSNNGLIETKALLAQFIQTYAQSEDEYSEVSLILQDIDKLTSPGTGALMLAKKLSTYNNNVELITTWLHQSNDLHYWDILPSVAQYVHYIAKGDHKSEQDLLLLSAEKGNPQSLYELARLYKNGHIVDINIDKARALFQKSAELGNANAQLDLGYYYEKGLLGLEKNDEIALQWYLKSAEQSHTIALNNLGNYYEHGTVVKQDLMIAAKYYNDAIAGGYDLALCNLGDLFLDYKEHLDVEKALSIYKTGADKGLSSCQFSLGYTYGEIFKDYEKALGWYQKAANQNHVAAITNLGHMYGKGNGVEIDLKKEFELTLKAADLGDATAQNNLGLSYEFGKGTKQDYVKAHYYYAKGAMQNHSGAMVNLGVFYTKGLVVEKNRQKSIELYRKAAANGNGPGAFNLGNAYLNGEGVERDLGQALEYYKQSAQAGIAESNCNLGRIYRELNDIDTAIRYFTLGAKKSLSTCEWQLGNTYSEKLNNYTQAIHWYKLAANRNNRDAYHSLGVLYDFGKGVEQDYVQAFKYYQLAADLGEPTSQANLGFMYEAGKGVLADNDMALKYYKKSAEQNDAQGLNNLATFYFNGTLVKQDRSKAISLYKRAAELSNSFALNNLGKAYRDGIGVEVDREIALSYFEKAAELDSLYAIEAAGIMYHQGVVNQANPSKAIKYLTRTSKEGYEVSSYYLGELFHTQKDPIRDTNKAIKYLTLSSEQGDIDAPHYLGEIYRKGEFVPVSIEKALFWHSKGVALNNSNSFEPLASILWSAADSHIHNPDKAIELLTQNANVIKENVNFFIGAFFHFGEYVNEDYKIAREYYAKGAEDGDGGSINNLAELYRFGLGGERDYELAVKLYKQAVDAGSLYALYNLGEMNRDGHGVEVDNKKALDWFLRAADQSVLDAMFQVATMYQQGLGTEINLSLANTWLLKASDMGDLAAKFAFGKNLIIGSGINKDENYGNELIEESANKGFEPAIEYLKGQK